MSHSEPVRGSRADFRTSRPPLFKTGNNAFHCFTTSATFATAADTTRPLSFIKSYDVGGLVTN